MQTKHFNVLDSFRGLCALCVVVFHMRVLGSITEWDFFRNSRLFVEFFFVLSGFVLAHSYYRKSNLHFVSYFLNRSFRIIPLHWFMLCVYLILEICKLVAYHYGIEFNTIPFTGNNAVRELLPNILLIQSWLPEFSYLSFNYPSWSISVEYYVYFAFFLLLMIKNITLRSALAIIVCLCMFLMPHWNVIVFTGEVMRGTGCFVAGILVYTLFYLTRNIFNLNNYIISSFIEFVCLGVTIYVVSVDMPFKNAFSTLIFSCTVFIFAFESGALSGLLRNNIFLYLGRLSYSIYLVHASLLFVIISFCMLLQKITKINFTINIAGERFLNMGDVFFNNCLVFVVLLLVVILSGFTYYFIEVPGQKLGKRLLQRTMR